MGMKIFFQKLCIEKLECDAELSDSKVTEWRKLVDVFTTEEVVTVRRKYSSKDGDENEINDAKLHGFSDDSSLAHGANIYSRTFYKFGLIDNTNLICSRKLLPYHVWNY